MFSKRFIECENVKRVKEGKMSMHQAYG